MNREQFVMEIDDAEILEMMEEMEAEEEPTFLEVLRDGPAKLIDHLIEMVSHFGEDSWQTDFIEGVFCKDIECFEIYEAQIAPHFTKVENDIYRYALLRCFSPNLDFPKQGFEAEFYLAQWQDVTRNLLQLDVHADEDSPWMYGWARYGCFIYDHQGRPRNRVWTLPCERRSYMAAVRGLGGGHLGDNMELFVDELPRDAKTLLSKKGVGERTVREVAKGITTMFLFPKKYTHPTLKEMMDPDFEP